MSWRRLIFSFLTVSLAVGLAQKGRITRELDRNRTVALKQHVHPNARAENDAGPVDPSLEMADITMHFKPSAAQQAELDRLLGEQRTPGSPNYQKFLTPEEFGARFGLSAADRTKITSWLKSEGFTVDYEARGQQWLSFTGTAQQVERSFQTRMRSYRVKGKLHYANATEPSVPEAFAEVIGGLRGLHDFRLEARHLTKSLLVPEYTGSTFNALVPDDLAIIYNIAPLYQAGIDGTGINLVVLGQSDYNISDIRKFRTQFGLPVNDPVTKLFGRKNPGVLPNEVDEASLDLEWAGAIARNANVVFALSTDVFLSAQYAADQNLGPVMTISYGGCEQVNGSSLRGIAQQASAQGITWLSAAGDSGAATCDGLLRGSPPQATLGRSVDIPASFPEVTAVGGTQFNEGAGNYWSRGNTANSASALSYIPEIAWNQTDSRGPAASGGGASILFSKPLWQTGPGVPNDGVRDVPDVSLTAAVHDPYFVTSTGSTFGIGGTSAATPAFAGIVALLNHYLMSKKIISQPGLGNINPALYRLAQTSPQAFHDITSGDNMVPCVQGSPDCVNGSFGYQAGPGYDAVTGLGSVDANNFVTLWNPQGPSTSMTLAASSTSVVQNAPLQLKATVTSANGATPQGVVNFGTADNWLGSAPVDGSAGTATATFTVVVPSLVLGNSIFTATYDGSSSLNGSSATVTVAVAASAAGSVIVPTVTPNPVYQNPLDGSWTYSIRLKESGGFATTVTAFTIDGVDAMTLVSQPAIRALNSITISATVSGLTAPVSRLFVFKGVDASGQTWSLQVPVWFYGVSPNDSIQLTSALSTVPQNTAADPSCQWSHPVVVQENGGFAMQLSRFTLGSTVLTSQIQSIFGTTRLAPYGTLQGTVCLSATDVSAGQSKSYALQAISDDGSTISTSLTAAFAAPPTNPVALTLSHNAISLRDGSAAATVGITLPDASQAWTASVVGSQITTRWLKLSANKGTGAGQVTLTASAAGLSDGVYNATLVIQSPNTNPPTVSVPVIFTVGSATTTSIAGVAHAASFKTTFAPGMIMSVFGTQLAPSTQQAASLPLPLSLAGVSATVNGVSARLYFVSQGQLNIQVPYETSAGLAVLAVNNSGQIASFTFTVSPAAPGIFVASGSTLVPASASRAGQVLVLYLTGEGDVTPSLGDGETPPSSTALRNLPKPRLPVTVSVAGAPAITQFVGIPSGLAGVTQINFVIPPTTPVGTQQVVVNVGGVDSQAANITITP